ncbi:chromosomal replication initiator protein DnaA [Agreia sp. PsM10]|jgi:chromosomal replication initiator protein|uniref:chromosomal replication initiator protein DnaA n=1 Tax=unclassified Agreia TaxID=2641148 RepID=UPI0007005F08|nr:MULTISPECIES: chromosomal replication initiator protein DnaA [unclassified Agreia]KQO11909.1 chromosomal replication initiator DnaA [Agreia sp. Leaf244]KQP53786.1 chromosomal replication initiator DnaA [Agreia sp. Leaf283]MDN4640526.1 chromosomal replication initiator protein DnaA [Agreia sp. PsM10]
MAEDDTSTEGQWRSVLQALSRDERITPQLRGFLGLVVPKGIMAGSFYLEVPNDFTRDMLELRVRPSLLTAIGQLDSGLDVTNFSVVVNPEISGSEMAGQAEASEPVYIETPPVQQQPTPAQETVGPPRNNDTRLNPKYSFDNFVIGGSNRFAHAAAVAVAEAPAKAYNPLFIYGDSGLGKTHLLHAIGHYAMSLYPGVRVRYVSSEEFTNDFINSIANNRGAAFHSRYRDIDLLLIDDIQFLQGKAETQEAFFHTFNTLHDHNKQVVITSDLPPKALTGFEDRMRTRFEWGLITDVQTPDLETRIAILRKKAQSEKLRVPDDILEYMATKVSSNVRELEGTLIRVTAFASLNRTPVDMQLVQTVLKDLITLDEDNIIAPVDIINHTAEYFKLSVDDLYGSSRSQAIATARQIAMYLCREMTSLSLPKIGQLFGGRDHTTVMYANNKIGKLMTEKRSIYNQVTEVSNRIKHNQRYKDV